MLTMMLEVMYSIIYDLNIFIETSWGLNHFSKIELTKLHILEDMVEF